MGVSGQAQASSRGGGATGASGERERTPSPTPAAVVWHDLECGGYSVDLPLWRELAERADGPVLDVGAGTGRVAIDLARAGSLVTALDSDPVLLAALEERAGGLPIEIAAADARSFELARREHALCIVPMQTVQLLGGRAGRLRFLRCARRHLRPGASLACAILGELEPFDCSGGGLGPAAEQTTLDGLLYLSRAVRVAEAGRGVVIERERRILAEREPPPRWPPAQVEELGEGVVERDVIELDAVSAAMLRAEGVEAGFEPRPTRELPATAEHVGSSVVVLGA